MRSLPFIPFELQTALHFCMEAFLISNAPRTLFPQQIVECSETGIFIDFLHNMFYNGNI